MELENEHGSDPPAPEELRPRGQGATGRSMRRGLAIAFSLLGSLATAVCGVLLILGWSIHGAVQKVDDGARATHQALALSLSVREQYIHEAHTILEGNATHLHHHDAWVRRAAEQARELEKSLPPDQVGRARRIARTSRELDQLFAERIVPAALSGDDERVRAAHHEAELLANRSQVDSDALVQALEARVAAIHEEALARSRLAVLVASFGTLLLACLGILLFVRLRRAVIVPLGSLTRAAQRVARGETGTPLGLVGSAEVATVAEAFDGMNAELAVRGRQLVHVERMAALGELAQVVADAIREPCAVVQERVAAYRERPDYASMRDELGILLEELESCHRIVDDLSLWAAVPRIELSETPIAEIVKNAMDRFRATELGARVELDADVEPATLSVDALRIRQVLNNLLRNAAEASPEGAVISVTGRPLSEGYELAVRDHGAGIPIESLERVFEPFYSRRSGGSGLGLAVCHGLVVAHGGTIMARLPDGGGTEIVVRLSAETRPS